MDHETVALEKDAPRGLLRLAVAAVCVFAVFFRLGERSLNEPDEGRYAEVGREMLVSGDYLTPRFEGMAHLSKPPITYWLVAASLKVFGVNEFAARLPSALAALGALGAIYRLVRDGWGETAALVATLVLITSAEFFLLARLITTDMILTALVCGSVWFLWRGVQSADRSWGRLMWFYVFLGLGMMTKGPVAVVIPLLALAGLRWGNPGLRLRELHWGKGIVVFLLLALPWFVLLILKDPSLWEYFVVREFLGRFASSVHGREEPWWFFLPVLAVGFLPWTALLFLAPQVLRNRTPRQNDLLRVCAGWAGGGLLLFTLSQSKLPTYVLPLLPPLAAVAGPVLERIVRCRLLQRGPPSVRILAAVMVGFHALIAVGLLRHAQERFALPPSPILALMSLTIAGAVAGVGAVMLKRERWFAAAAVTAPMLLWLTAIALWPTVENHLAAKAGGKLIARRIQQADPAATMAVVCYKTFPTSLPFYLQREVQWYDPPPPGKSPKTNRNEWPPAWAEAFQGQEAAPHHRPELLARLNGARRVIWVLQRRHLNRLQNHLETPLEVMDHVGPFTIAVSGPRGIGPAPSVQSPALSLP